MKLNMLDFLRENKQTHKNEFGCVMIFFDFPQLNEIQNHIHIEDLYEDPNDDSFGLETEPHCTLLFGLHPEVTTQQVKDIINKFNFTTLTPLNISKFENPKYDVLKYDIGYKERDGNYLNKINKELSKYPHTNKFPDYHPHSTIAYLKPGKADEYINYFKDKDLNYELNPKYVIYSKIDGTKDKIKINESKRI